MVLSIIPNFGPSNVGPSNVDPSNVGPSNVGPSNVGPSNVGPSNVGLAQATWAKQRGLGSSNVGPSTWAWLKLRVRHGAQTPFRKSGSLTPRGFSMFECIVLSNSECWMLLGVL